MLKKEKLKWSDTTKDIYGRTIYVSSRLMPDGVCVFIYEIFTEENGGYTARAMNNAYGAERIAVSSYKHKTNKPSVFKDLKKLMSDIESGKQLWKYTEYCKCIGKVTREEY